MRPTQPVYLPLLNHHRRTRQKHSRRQTLLWFSYETNNLERVLEEQVGGHLRVLVAGDEGLDHLIPPDPRHHRHELHRSRRPQSQWIRHKPTQDSCRPGVASESKTEEQVDQRAAKEEGNGVRSRRVTRSGMGLVQLTWASHMSS